MKLGDIHSHVLPFMDDGAQDLEMTYKMLCKMQEDGISTVVATPHFNFMKDDIETFLSKRESSMNSVKAFLKETNLNIELRMGTELMFGPGITDIDLSQHVIEKTDYLIIEFSTRKKTSNVVSILNNIIGQGFIPIIAHVERFSFLLDDGALMIKLINMGVLFQLNSETALDNPQLTQTLMKKNLIHLIASDAHNTTNRTANIKEAFDALTKEQSTTIKENIQMVLNNDVIEVPIPKRLKKIFNKYI